jgi:proteasome alpha subunit
MSMSWYVPAEQQMKDKADFARKGIARGKALAAVSFDDGILICAENSSSTLRKVSEIYDRIAFAGAGRYNEYDRLRVAGVRHADLKGYSFSREDVDAQSLANAYAQMVGDVFTHEIKPMEVEIVVAELGATPEDDRMFHILYDGTVVDEPGLTVLGGEAEAIVERVKQSHEPDRPLDAALRTTVAALAGSGRQIDAADLEVAVLSRRNGRRAFRRLTDTEVAGMLAGGDGKGSAEETTSDATATPDAGATTDAGATDSDGGAAADADSTSDADTSDASGPSEGGSDDG